MWINNFVNEFILPNLFEANKFYFILIERIREIILMEGLLMIFDLNLLVHHLRISANWGYEIK